MLRLDHACADGEDLALPALQTLDVTTAALALDDLVLTDTPERLAADALAPRATANVASRAASCAQGSDLSTESTVALRPGLQHLH